MTDTDWDKALAQREAQVQVELADFRHEINLSGQYRFNTVEQIAARDGSSDCWLCGGTTRNFTGVDDGSPDRATLDHIVPTSKGGTSDLTNLKIAHARCNTVRGSRSPHAAWEIVRNGYAEFSDWDRYWNAPARDWKP